jgi:hypothetical protein
LGSGWVDVNCRSEVVAGLGVFESSRPNDDSVSPLFDVTEMSVAPVPPGATLIFPRLSARIAGAQVAVKTSKVIAKPNA